MDQNLACSSEESLGLLHLVLVVHSELSLGEVSLSDLISFVGLASVLQEDLFVLKALQEMLLILERLNCFRAPAAEHFDK